MFTIIKSIVWIIGILVIAYFALGYFGYQVNLNYFTYSKARCEQAVTDCTNTVIHKGIDSKCNFNCVDPSLIIKKK